VFRFLFSPLNCSKTDWRIQTLPKWLEDTDITKMTGRYRHYQNDEDTETVKMAGGYSHKKMTGRYRNYQNGWRIQT
jgi:hypothetical protein